MSDGSTKRWTLPIRSYLPEKGGVGIVESDTVDRSVLPNFNGRPNWNRRPKYSAARERPEKPQE
jgi:hypothetical protein